MREPTRLDDDGKQQQRISDELRQLKQMSKGLRIKAFRALMERTAAKPVPAKPLPAKSVALPAKPSSFAA
jgi:hypothetical protein